MYYVYAYLDPRKPGQYNYDGLNCSFLYEPFYIGKGKKDRMYLHLRAVKFNHILKISKYFKNKIKSILNDNLEPFIVVIESNLENVESYLKEYKCIKNIGRIIDGQGPLVNMHLSKDGSNGMSDDVKKKISETKKKKPAIWSEERREQMSKKNRGINNPMYGKKHTSETISKMLKNRTEHVYTLEDKEKLSKIHKGHKRHSEKQLKILRDRMTNRIVSDETKQKMSDSKKGKKMSISAKLNISLGKKGKKRGFYKIKKVIKMDDNMNIIKTYFNNIELLKDFYILPNIKKAMKRNMKYRNFYWNVE